MIINAMEQVLFSIENLDYMKVFGRMILDVAKVLNVSPMVTNTKANSKIINLTVREFIPG